MPAMRSRSQAAQERSDNLLWTRGTASVTLPASASASIVEFTNGLEIATGEEARNWTIERIIGNIVYTIPASTAPGRSYSVFTAIDMMPVEAVVSGAYPEPFAANRNFPWVDGRRVYADHTVPASYTSPGLNGIINLDMRSKRRAKGVGQQLRMFGYHDNGLSANPGIEVVYSCLWRLR